VENVIAWYDPLIPPQELGDHYFWTNFILREYTGGGRKHYGSIEELQDTKGFDLKGEKGDKRVMLRNCVEPELGKYILDLAITPINLQKSIF